ncbi:zinc finger protein 91 isoform X1 [Trematomus bernacchii]|uniref:zinc finger protein 91 isoform X1 n=1 Tax=Trematomus bernacchii TaxID=40690 RepID=UPI00146E9EFB|nr:zinc finger protein 91 isoform X1 [Trematomus bernacchii]
MDEAAAEIREDGAENKTHDGDTTSENNVDPSAEDTADGVGVFCCRDCGEAFREEAAFLEHRHQHPQESVHLDKQLDGLHDAERDNETTNFCTICSLSFVEPSELISHMEKCHGQTLQKESGIQITTGITKQHTYECAECGKCYFVIGHFLNHQRSHRQASKSVFHDLEHLKKKSFQCESCGRNYSRASALDAHRRCHEGKLVKSRNKNSAEAFHTEESIVEAKPSESQTPEVTPEKTFKCSCGKAFTAMMRLKTHQRFSRNSLCSPEEMKEKPKKSCNEFYCDECKKAFTGHIALFNHQRWHANHSDDSAERFPCEECGKVFMTLTFYYRHQRTAHSKETPAKSFLHQVCQLQKKAFECKDCGLKFSRASALHSHQLNHTDVYGETEKESHVSTSLLPQQKTLDNERKETKQEEVTSENVPPISVVEEDSHANESDEDLDSYDPGDFIVQVISASESEDEAAQDTNPDLELLCESDQENKNEGDTGVSPSSLVLKPEMDLKIVEIDFEQTDEQCALIAKEAENKTTEERFDCPECYRWFSSASSLRVHRMWHGVRKRKQQNPGQSVAVHTCDTCGHKSNSHAAHCSHIQQHKNPKRNSDGESEGLETKNLVCNECGKSFSRLSALVSHQLHHPKRKPYQCPDCMMSYSYAASFVNHVKNCSAQKKGNILVSKKEYNPKKTLLGPKIYHCEQCGKGFWSLGAYSHHKQSQTECTDLRLRKGAPGSLHSVNGHQRPKVACPVCGRQFRHKGIMALHMRKHENGNHKCELCNRSFRLFSSLLRHQVVHSELLPPPIKSFQHQVEQLKKNTYSCPDCGKLFSRAKALQFHMKSHGYETGHSPSSPRSTVTLEDLQCATCLAHFNNKASLRAHRKLCIKRESQVVDFKTEPSENEYTQKDSMDVSTQGSSEQITLHTEVKQEQESVQPMLENQTGEGKLGNPSTTNLKYKCKKCDRSFSVAGALNFHKRIHADDDKSAKAKMAVSVMLKKPKQEEPSKGHFHCSECGRRFMSNSALGSHRRWHKEKKLTRSLLKDDELKSDKSKSEDGPFQCQKCDKQFFDRRVLQRHKMFNPRCQTKTEPELNSNQSVESHSRLNKSKFVCLECNATFEQQFLLAAHYENEHNTLETADHAEDGLAMVDQEPKQVDVNFSRSELMSSISKPKAHQCPICSMTFAKARGLHAHKWQAHSKRTKSKNKIILKIKNNASSSEVKRTEQISNVDKEMKKTRAAPPLVRYVSCLDCGKQCSSTEALFDHKKVCHEIKEEKIKTPETVAEVSPPLSRLSEHIAKCLFKCDKCGKAFQTEEHLGTHKTKAKSRPYCCALCCIGFWSENQLQQHLAWHDEVRCRLPNEVRYRIGAALTSKPLKANVPSADTRGTPSSSENQSQKSHKCQHCGKAFLSPTALQKHETQHCNNDSYHCSICPRTFSEIQDLIDHHQECIGDYKRQNDAPAAVSSVDADSLTCLECGTTFCQETDLHKHYMEHAHGVYYTVQPEKD